MRHDVKLGFAVGGILLAVLIVYVSVVGRNAARPAVAHNPADTTVIASPSSSGASNSSAVSSATGNTPAVVAPPSHPDSLAPAVGATGNTPVLTTETPSAAASGAVASSSAKASPASGGATGSPNDVFESSKPTDPSAGNQMWDKLMANGPSSVPATGSGATSAAVEATPAVSVTPAVSSANVKQEVVSLMSSSDFADAASSKTTSSSGHSASISTPAMAPTAGGVYSIQRGDTFARIAESKYGSQGATALIVKLNPGVDPHHLKIGQKINLPSSAEVQQVKSTSATSSKPASVETPVAAGEYRVGKEDSLYRIAMRFFGKGSMASKIYELNKGTIGSDPAKLKVGMVLKLPAGAKAN